MLPSLAISCGYIVTRLTETKLVLTTSTTALYIKSNADPLGGVYYQIFKRVIKKPPTPVTSRQED